MNEVVVVEAVRSPIGRRGGGLASIHPADLLGAVQSACIERSGIDPAEIGQVVGGCVSKVGAQDFNIARTAWLSAGLPISVPASTVDTQCGSSQHALNLATALIASGAVDAAVACGVESMSTVPIGAASSAGPGRPLGGTYRDRFEYTTQFEGAERIADRWGITRGDCDELGVESQRRAAAAWSDGRFDGQIVPVEVPVLDEHGKRTSATTTTSRDEGLRDTTPEGLAALKPVGRPDGVHTAGSSSQIADGAAAVLLMSGEKASALGLRPRARVVDHCLVGVDPVLMLTGPIAATARLLETSGRTIDDIDVFENNEAFASVVLAWEREHKPDMERVNPNGGAIALGHPLGGSGVILLTKLLHELERRDATTGMVTMCCGGGVGTGTLVERV
jgi:acetyl-CoA C-acetyltransferase